MPATAFVLDVVFERETCCACGLPFAVPVSFMKMRRESHSTFYCPNGHSLSYPAQTENEELRALLKDERERHGRTLSRLNTAEQKARKHERAAKRMSARVSRGVCPCCNRTFGNLARHMATKHPEQVPKSTPGTLPDA